MVVYLAFILTLLLGLAGLFLVILTLPGLWLMLAGAAVYAMFTHIFGFKSLLVLFVLAAAGELLELAVGGAATRRSGGGKLSIVGAVVGGVLGGIFLTFIPIPVVGTLVGVCLGSFFGAVFVELISGKRLGYSLRVGLAAGTGRLGGIIIKLMIGVVMLAVIMIAGFP